MSRAARQPSVSRAERDSRRRQQLIDTALELFTQRGYANTPIELLCSESGVTTRYFYQLFGSREALMRATYDQVLDTVIRRVTQAVASAPRLGVQALLELGLREFVDAYLRDTRLTELACVQAVGISPDMERHRRTAMHRFADLLDDQARGLHAAGLVQHAETGSTTLGLVGGIHEMITDWLYTDPRPPLEHLHLAVVRLFRIFVAGATAIGPGEA